MPSVRFATPDFGAGAFAFGDPEIPGNPPVIGTQPADQVGVYNVAGSYDVGALFAGALSYSVAEALAEGVTFNATTGAFDWGSSVDPHLNTYTVTGYELAAQGGDSTTAHPFDLRLDLPILAKIDFPPLATSPSGVLAGLTLTDLATFEVVSWPAGWTATGVVGGDIDYTYPDAETPTTYDIEWRAWDAQGAIIPGTLAVVVPIVPIPTAITGATTLSFVATGALESAANLISGNSSLDFVSSASLQSVVYISGSTGLTFAGSGSAINGADTSAVFKRSSRHMVYNGI